MPNLVEFKQEIKQKQNINRLLLKQIEKEIIEFRRRITVTTRISVGYFKTLFPCLGKQLEILSLTKNYFKKGLGEKEDKNSELSEINYVVDVDSDLDEILSTIRKSYNEVQSVINAMDNDKIINYIDLDNLFSLFVNSSLPISYIYEIMGLVVGFDMKYVQTHSSDVPNKHYVEALSEYFNEDGTPKLNEDIDRFKEILLVILTGYISTFKLFSGINIISENSSQFIRNNLNKFIDDCCDMLIKSNKRIKELPIIVIEEPRETLDTIKSSVDRKYLDELRKYYRNKELVEIPEDMESFMDLLDKCEIDDLEKRYILGLINELKGKSVDKIEKYLNINDRNIYDNAIHILSEMHYSNGDYYLLVQLLDDLKAVGDILDETDCEEDKEYLEIEISDLIAKTEEVINKYLIKEESDNTILFLLDENEVPYVKLDSDLIDGSFYKMICNGIKKIRKDNQNNFRLVMTSEDMSYRVYDILSSKTHIAFIEVDSGIYLLVGVDVLGHGYEEIVRRVINHESDIKRIETLVKNKNSRNSILSKHLEYSNLFNPDTKELTRKIKKENN